MKRFFAGIAALLFVVACAAPRAPLPPPHKFGANVFTDVTQVTAGTTTTANAVGTIVSTLAVADKEVEVYEVDVLAVRQTTSNPYIAAWRIYATVGRDPSSGNAAFVTGGASATANPLTLYQHTPVIGGATPSAALAVSGTNMTLTVTGVATTTIVWQWVVRERVLSST